MASYNQSAILAFKSYNAEVECIQEAFEEFYDEMDYAEQQGLYGPDHSDGYSDGSEELTELEEAARQEAEWAQEQAREEWQQAWDEAWQEADQDAEVEAVVNKPEVETAW